MKTYENKYLCRDQRYDTPRHGNIIKPMTDLYGVFVTTPFALIYFSSSIYRAIGDNLPKRKRTRVLS